MGRHHVNKYDEKQWSAATLTAGRGEEAATPETAEESPGSLQD